MSYSQRSTRQVPAGRNPHIIGQPTGATIVVVYVVVRAIDVETNFAENANQLILFGF